MRRDIERPPTTPVAGTNPIERRVAAVAPLRHLRRDRAMAFLAYVSGVGTDVSEPTSALGARELTADRVKLPLR